ncbi:MAG: metallophosphoesterase [Deltaproteobacteria bacterium]|jgi:predicted MPP superfamily phosphohydrolase|nr:metallophosphoesterase [Deltaproteobacteria bacterium]
MFFNPLIPPAMILAQILAWLFLARRLGGAARAIAKGIYLLANVAALGSFYALYYSPGPPTVSALLWDYVYRPAFLWEAVHLAWLPLALALSVLGLALRRLSRPGGKGLQRLFKADTRKPRLLDARVALLALMLALAAYGYAHQLAPPRVRAIDVPIAGLPPALEGFRVALVSDLHYGLGQNLTGLAAAMAQAASLRPDLVILAGDLVDRRASLALDFRIPVHSLGSVPHGVYAVLGNHDRGVDDPDALVANLRAAGLPVLMDQRLNLPGLPLSLIGFDDPGDEGLEYHGGRLRLDFGRVKGPPPRPGDLEVAVSHRPEGIADASSAGARLMLSGHTHGGQVAAPWDDQLNLASLVFGFPYSSGLYRISDLTLFVTSGLASGFQFRLFAWPEIAVLTLRGQPQPANP